MKGARGYNELFETGQYGKLYITVGRHARGETLRIQILPEGEKAIPNGSNNICLNKNAVLVYGPISGQLGWTEEYGWIHKGKWEKDFFDLVQLKLKEQEKNKKNIFHENLKKEQKEKERIKNLLNKY